MTKFVSVLLLTAFSALSACAQQSLAEMAAQAKASKLALPGDAPSREKVLKLLDLIQVRQTVETMFTGMKRQMQESAEQGFRSKVPNATPEQIGQLRGMVDDVFSEISVNDLIRTIVPVYQRHLTNSDIDAIIGFYSSPIGQKLLREQPAMMRESMEAAATQQQQKMEALMRKLDQRVAALAKTAQN